MKRSTIILSLLLLAGCGDPATKKNSTENSTSNGATNGATNGGTNNGGTNNGGTNNILPTNNLNAASGSLVADPATVAFAQVAIGDTDTQGFDLINTGAVPITVSSAELVEETVDDGNTEFGQGDWPEGEMLVPQQSATFGVTYTPADPEPDTGYVEVAYVDGMNTGTLRVELVTPDLEPQLFHNDNVIFARVPPVTEDTRDTHWQLTEAQNIGQAPLLVSDIIISPIDANFSVSYPESLDPDADPANDALEPPMRLEPDESLPIRIYFNPEDDLPETAELIFFTNDPENPEFVVNLVGNSG